jgi:N6-adenosine-specific RNA methylase IME4
MTLRISDDAPLSESFKGGECAFCVKTFPFGVRAATIRRHERICGKNPDRRKWYCPTCDRFFPQGSGLFKHRKSVSHLEKGGLPPVPQKRNPKPPYIRVAQGEVTKPFVKGKRKGKSAVVPLRQEEATRSEGTVSALKDLEVAVETYKAALLDGDDLTVTACTEAIEAARGRLKSAREVDKLAADAASVEAAGAEGVRYEASSHPRLEGVPRGVFHAILVDPPFQYARSCGSGVAENRYKTMTDEELTSLPVGLLAAKNAMLFLWCSGPTIDRGVKLCKDWGFKYKTVAFVWVKTTKAGVPHGMGLGSYTRPGAEYVLVAGKGKAASMITARPNQVFMGPRRAHSEKPSETRAFIDEMLAGSGPTRKIELFCRSAVDDAWSVWGDELDSL